MEFKKISIDEFINYIYEHKPVQIFNNFRRNSDIKVLSFIVGGVVDGVHYETRLNSTVLTDNTYDTNVFLKRINYMLRKEKILKLRKNGQRTNTI